MIGLLIFAIALLISVLVVIKLGRAYLADGLQAGEIYKLVTVFAIIWILSGIGIASFTEVGVGHGTIIVDPIANTISDPVLGAKWFFRPPWTYTVDIYYAIDTFSDVIPCFTSDQLEMQIEVLIRWELDPNKLAALYRKYPTLQYKASAIESIMEETIRLITKQYTSLETIENRDLVVSEIETAVLKEIREEPSLVEAMIHLEMDVKNIGYPEKYTAAIEDKLVAEQQFIQAEFERSRILVLANATAQQQILEASGYAEAKIIQADGTRTALEILLSMYPDETSTRYLELYTYLEALKDMDVPVVLVGLGEDGMPVIFNFDPTTLEITTTETTP